jgi:hypothetical protein
MGMAAWPNISPFRRPRPLRPHWAVNRFQLRSGGSTRGEPTSRSLARATRHRPLICSLVYKKNNIFFLIVHQRSTNFLAANSGPDQGDPSWNTDLKFLNHFSNLNIFWFWANLS